MAKSPFEIELSREERAELERRVRLLHAAAQGGAAGKDGAVRG